MMGDRVIIIGVNGNCIDIAETIELLARGGRHIRVIGFLDDNPELEGQSVAGYPVLGRISDAARFEDALFVNGIGSPRSYKQRPEIIRKSGIPNERWVTIVHPSAIVSPRASIGRGTTLLGGVSVGAGARIGCHVTILQNAVISHDSVVGDYTAIATGVCVSGMCVIGSNCYLGSNCAIRDGIRVGDRALVGLGAVVVADVAHDAVVMGNPARPRQ